MSHERFRAGLVDGSIQVHCLWFDIHTAQVFYFDKYREKKFIEINTETAEGLMAAAGAEVFDA